VSELFAAFGSDPVKLLDWIQAMLYAWLEAGL
jgi:hypothetical protein